MAISSVHSSQYFPCIAYFATVLASDKVTIDLGERFVKQTYRNRCEIYSANGSLSLSVPVIKNNTSLVKEVLLDKQTNWKANHWKAISSAYNSSPFFDYYCDDLKEVFFKEYISLHDLNKALFDHISYEIGLNTKVLYSKEYIKELSPASKDYRKSIVPKKPLFNSLPRYIQTFEAKHGFLSNLSILDLLFHEGPETLTYLKELNEFDLINI